MERSAIRESSIRMVRSRITLALHPGYGSTVHRNDALRHSGAMRSIEPGIHNHQCPWRDDHAAPACRNNHVSWLWIVSRGASDRMRSGGRCEAMGGLIDRRNLAPRLVGLKGRTPGR